MTTLPALLLDPALRPSVVGDLAGVVDEEVRAKKGISGGTVKAALATVHKVSPHVVETSIDKMLPDFSTALQPFWADFAGDGRFGAYLAGRGDEAAAALVAVTDRKAKTSSRAPLRKAYGALRPRALENVKTALPRLGDVIQKYAATAG